MEEQQADAPSTWSSATVVAAVIGCISAVLSAILPWWLGSRAHEKTSPPATVNVPVAVVPVTPVPTAKGRALPNLTFGVWTIVESTDEAGTDFRGSTINFKTQRETAEGLELTGFFQWRNDNNGVLGQEHFVAHFDAVSWQLFIEG